MVYKKLQLFPEKPWVTLECYLNELKGNPRDAILIIPGGGYSAVCSDREGFPIAAAYYLQGMHSFVLTYSVGAQIDHYTQPLEEAAAALMYIRSHAAELGVSPRVFAAGFSAGGHLAAWLASMWNAPLLSAVCPQNRAQLRLNGAVLCYAVINEYRAFCKETSFNSLYQKSELTPEELERVELSRHIGADSAPAFILHSFDDGRVTVENALDLARAYTRAGVPFEMHIYPHAPHGHALCTDVTWNEVPGHINPQIARWVEDSRLWMKSLPDITGGAG